MCQEQALIALTGVTIFNFLHARCRRICPSSSESTAGSTSGVAATPPCGSELSELGVLYLPYAALELIRYMQRQVLAGEVLPSFVCSSLPRQGSWPCFVRSCCILRGACKLRPLATVTVKGLYDLSSCTPAPLLFSLKAANASWSFLYMYSVW